MTNGKNCGIVQKETKMGTKPGKERDMMTTTNANNFNQDWNDRAMLMDNGYGFIVACSDKKGNQNIIGYRNRKGNLYRKEDCIRKILT